MNILKDSNESFKSSLKAIPVASSKMVITNPPLWNVQMVKPFLPSLPLIVGDCVQNYRAAFDYVAYELGLRSGMSSEG
jgi:hypothetical protein